mmetsp:Transcript_158586/g.508769  ORF Transcript_158586/g.508769 Transcript_158586/m.508769 type:complete len:244 (+) Transcript_158586:1662-2393(+)
MRQKLLVAIAPLAELKHVAPGDARASGHAPRPDVGHNDGRALAALQLQVSLQLEATLILRSSPPRLRPLQEDACAALQPAQVREPPVAAGGRAAGRVRAPSRRSIAIHRPLRIAAGGVRGGLARGPPGRAVHRRAARRGRDREARRQHPTRPGPRARRQVAPAPAELLEAREHLRRAFLAAQPREDVLDDHQAVDLVPVFFPVRLAHVQPERPQLGTSAEVFTDLSLRLVRDPPRRLLCQLQV